MAPSRRQNLPSSDVAPLPYCGLPKACLRVHHDTYANEYCCLASIQFVNTIYHAEE